ITFVIGVVKHPRGRRRSTRRVRLRGAARRCRRMDRRKEARERRPFAADAGDSIVGMTATIDRIRTALEALSPAHLEVLDESHMHSRGLETHYKAVVVGDAFEARGRVQRHQMVYRALGPLMDEIHALALHTYTPQESAATQTAPDSPACRGGSRHDPPAGS